MIAGASLALHLVVLSWLARPAGPVATGPPAMILELVRPPPRPSRSRPVERTESPRRPSVSAAASPPRSGSPAFPRPAPAGAAPGPPAQDATPAAADAVRSALRASLGCARPVGLTRQEREACAVRLGRLPCSIPLQGSVFTPEAMVRKR